MPSGFSNAFLICFLSFFGALQQDLDMDSTDLPKVIRCSADRISETGVYLLGEYLSCCRYSSPKLGPVSTKTASFQVTVLLESFIMSVAKNKTQNTELEVKNV